MLIVSNGVLYLLVIRSSGNRISLFTRLNIIARVRFLALVLKEVMIKCDIESPLDALKRTGIALAQYMQEFERIDI